MWDMSGKRTQKLLVESLPTGSWVAIGSIRRQTVPIQAVEALVKSWGLFGPRKRPNCFLKRRLCLGSALRMRTCDCSCLVSRCTLSPGVEEESEKSRQRHMQSRHCYAEPLILRCIVCRSIDLKTPRSQHLRGKYAKHSPLQPQHQRRYSHG